MLSGGQRHDVGAAGNDHQAIGKGRIDFAMGRQFWPPHHLRGFELHRSVEPGDVRESKQRIENLLG
jgi:hypothetical protein